MTTEALSFAFQRGSSRSGLRGLRLAGRGAPPSGRPYVGLALGMLAFVRFFLVSGEAVSDLEIPSAEDAQEQEREIVSEAPVVEGAK